MKHTTTQSGSVFFIIILAIAMFAGLSYAVFRGGSEGTAQLSNDQARLAAQDMISFSTSMQKTIQTMRLRGITETQFDFSNDVYKAVNDTAITLANTLCTDDICKVFNINGGKITPMVPPSYALGTSPGPATYKAGHAGFWVLRVEGIGTPSPDLLMVNPFLKKEVCIKINELLGIENPAGEPPNDNYGTMQTYSGDIATFPNPAGYGLGDQASQVISKSIFCATHASDPRMWTVLLAR